MSVDHDQDASLVQRIKENPGPALGWFAGLVVLFALEAGAVVHFVTGFFGSGVELPTLLSRDLIPNNGFQTPGGAWKDTFLGLAPAYAWALRVVLIYAYAFLWLVWLWRVWRTAMLTPSTTALPALGSTLLIVPFWPLSLPARTITLSPFFSLAAILQHLRGERDDFHEAFRTQLAHHRPEDARAQGLARIVQDDGGVAVEADGGSVFATNLLLVVREHSPQSLGRILAGTVGVGSTDPPTPE